MTLGDSELHSTITEKLQNLSHFTQQILLVAALAQRLSDKPTSISQLVKITGNSIARLSIYLWPANQELLLETVDNLDNKSASLNFTPAHVIDSIILFASGDQTLCLAHFRLCSPQLLKVDQQHQIVNFCLIAISNISHFNSHVLNQSYTLLINCKRIHESNISNINPFYIEQLAIWIELGMFDQAQQRILYLQTQPLTFEQRISLAIIASQRLVKLKKPEQALLLLTDTAAQYCGIEDASNLESNVLFDISFQLEAIAKHFNDQPEYFIQPVINKRIRSSLFNQLRLLKKIISICQQAHFSLRAAGAIARMFSLSLTACDDYYAAFACAHFAWVCSWFAADIQIASACRDRALYLASQHSELHLQQCKLILATKLNHWFEPLNLTVKALQLEATFFNRLTAKMALKRQVLIQQLLLCQGEPLKIIARNCQQLLLNNADINDNSNISVLNSMLETSQSLLLAPQSPHFETVNYQDSIAAFSQLFTACYTFDQQHWEIMQSWDAQIETDISSHYIATEAVFICTLMRIASLDSLATSDLNKKRVDGDINRRKMWSDLRAQNYSAQYTLLKALYCAKFNPIEQAINYFEAAYLAVEKYGRLQHQILFYHYYAKLIEKHSPALSTLCLEKKQQKIDIWHR